MALASKTCLIAPVLTVWVAAKAEGTALDSDVWDAAVEDCNRSLSRRARR